jgi:hypothetical protein
MNLKSQYIDIGIMFFLFAIAANLESYDLRDQPVFINEGNLHPANKQTVMLCPIALDTGIVCHDTCRDECIAVKACYGS